MTTDAAMLFIDTNSYLDLYRTDKGKQALAPLGEQKSHVFVTQQVVNEVLRNKIDVASKYLSEKFKELKLQTYKVPDHLVGPNPSQRSSICSQMQDISRKITAVNKDVQQLGRAIIEQISQSRDEVSESLAPIFATAVQHTDDEMKRARRRRELGNPPGKPMDPLGDQLTWEQLLTRFEGKSRLWIISRDNDYGPKYDGKRFTNPFLLAEVNAIEKAAEVYRFDSIAEGIDHFVKTTGVKTKHRLTEQQIQEIKEEEESLPELTSVRPESHFLAGRAAWFDRRDEDLFRTF